MAVENAAVAMTRLVLTCGQCIPSAGNIRGGLNNFREVFPDEGDVDMFELTAALYDNGYKYVYKQRLLESLHAFYNKFL